MKRSEAIRRLRCYIEDQNSGMVCAEQILAFVEGALGMSPPYTREPAVLTRDKKNRPLAFVSGKHGGCNKWDAEGADLEQYQKEQADYSWQEPED